ncbi:FRG1-like family-domain-containing protein [Colletotrichum godetiae]|uniref:FRG1-like family-domain-containing protein n=1 Tax=Colletotrichum godetiae TaxID=1209918 RepID=A0AAJ0AV33_9PEZI|nr:FRG1-like family-domain-containing protein [Colletotrichum godetiae]KAK1690338.1 FRG1-like family-domain-containing protein [Colletotrichum godetiae]
MVKPLSFKGDKKPKKRKRAEAEAQDRDTQGGEVARTGGASASTANADDDDDSWVSADAVTDVVGPVMFVLPTEPPTALACDAVGKIFTLGIENIVEGNPSTAEPHDVRQVWVANRITGTEQFRFKGHHGQYLGCDKNGVLSATSVAVSPLESFNVIATADTPGTFQLQTLRDTFLSVKPPRPNVTTSEVRGDEESITFNTTWRIRMQARFKPRLKANKEEKAKEKISRKELEQAVGRRLEDDEVRKLKRARREGDYHEQLLMLKVKGKHDKYG